MALTECPTLFGGLQDLKRLQELRLSTPEVAHPAKVVYHLLLKLERSVYESSEVNEQILEQVGHILLARTRQNPTLFREVESILRRIREA